jgi:hypothetical protein
MYVSHWVHCENIYSQTWAQQQPLDPKKVAVVHRAVVVQGLVLKINLIFKRFIRVGDSGQLLLTGGQCSEVNA